MTYSAALDNDVVYKLARYLMLVSAQEQVFGSSPVGVLGAARYVVSSLIDRISDDEGQQAAREQLKAFLDLADVLEPTDPEVELATLLEEAALVAGVQVDAGETQLMAMSLLREIELLVTGDKRAIKGAEALLGSVAELGALAERMVCLEQVIATLLARLGLDECRERVCAAPCDKALTISFGCHSRAPRQQDVMAGLVSYVNDLRRSAPQLLYPSEVVSGIGSVSQEDRVGGSDAGH